MQFGSLDVFLVINVQNVFLDSSKCRISSFVEVNILFLELIKIFLYRLSVPFNLDRVEPVKDRWQKVSFLVHDF